jgi:four helix bundle protein
LDTNCCVPECPWERIIELLVGGKSKADFIAKAGISLEEADECFSWMELLQEAGISPVEQFKDLMKEADELVAIFTASIKTARVNLR